MKNIKVFLSEKFQFLEVKFSIYLNRRVFVMCAFFVSKGNRIYFYFVGLQNSYNIAQNITACL